MLARALTAADRERIRRRIEARLAGAGPIAARVALRQRTIVRWSGIGPVPYPQARTDAELVAEALASSRSDADAA